MFLRTHSLSSTEFSYWSGESRSAFTTYSNVLRLDGIERGAGLPQGELTRRFAMVPSVPFGNHVAGSGPNCTLLGTYTR